MGDVVMMVLGLVEGERGKLFVGCEIAVLFAVV